MKPVFPNETRRERALFAARLRIQGTELSSEAVREVCEELLERAAVPTSAPIEPGRLCKHGVPYARPCPECEAIRKGGVPYEPGGRK